MRRRFPPGRPWYFNDKPQPPIYCPSCQSPDIKRIARLDKVTVCCCEKCSTEFTVSEPRE